MAKQHFYPDKLEIKPLDRPANATIRVPGSKSITNRALVLAALACRDVVGVLVDGVDPSEDVEHMYHALVRLGFEIESGAIKNPNSMDLIPAASADLFVGNSGTCMRFLAAMVSLGTGRYRLDGDERMRQRPIEDLLLGLRQLGVNAYSEFSNGCPPVVIETVGLRGGHVDLRADTSSQFLSAILMACTYAKRETTICVSGPIVSEPYVALTLHMMRDFGVGVARPSPDTFRIPTDQRFWHTWYEIEPDATAASYFYAAAAITQGDVAIEDFYVDKSIQGDAGFKEILTRMRLHRQSDPLHGIDVDMNAISDTVPTLAAVACFADSPTTIRNVAHIRHKECDRISALCTELRKLGVEVAEFPDGLRITPRPMHGAEIETYNDHRIAMSIALIGLRVPGVVIKNPGCVAKTYPGYWEDFEKLYE